MRVVLDLQLELLDDREKAAVFQAYIQAAALHNAILMRKYSFPSLYDANIRFANEPWAGKFEEIASAPLVLQRGWADCDDLTAWRIGEEIAAYRHAHPKIYWRYHANMLDKVDGSSDGARLFHAEVRLQDGSVEDPSRLLGM